MAMPKLRLLLPLLQPLIWAFLHGVDQVTSLLLAVPPWPRPVCRCSSSSFLQAVSSNGENSDNSSNNSNDIADPASLLDRRDILQRVLLPAASPLLLFGRVLTAAPGPASSSASSASSSSLDALRGELQKARSQMAPIPDLIGRERWASVRAVLITPPLSDLWTKSGAARRSSNLLKDYADAVGQDPKGDELAVLEAKDELLSHLRYLDMAVYNNVFNPITASESSGGPRLRATS